MKKKIFAVTAAILFTVSATFANEPVPATIVNGLHQEFKYASNVAWKTTPSFYKASFTEGNHVLEAFFGYDGQLIGVSRKLQMEQLPLRLMKEATQNDKAAAITDLFELSTNRGTEYFISYGTGKEQKTFKSNGTSWSRYYPDTSTYGL